MGLHNFCDSVSCVSVTKFTPSKDAQHPTNIKISTLFPVLLYHSNIFWLMFNMYKDALDKSKWIYWCKLIGGMLAWVQDVFFVVVLEHAAVFISILHCLKAPLSTQPPHATKSLLSLFDFANANQSLTENRAARLQSTKQVPDIGLMWQRTNTGAIANHKMPSGSCFIENDDGDSWWYWTGWWW